jgi:hypothetical protein
MVVLLRLDYKQFASVKSFFGRKVINKGVFITNLPLPKISLA